MKNTTIAIDLAKSVFEVGISERPGHVARNHRLSRAEVSAGASLKALVPNPFNLRNLRLLILFSQT